MVTRNHGANGAKLDIDRLVEAINSLPKDGPITRQDVFASLREHFPMIAWTTLHDGALIAHVNADYRP